MRTIVLTSLPSQPTHLRPSPNPLPKKRENGRHDIHGSTMLWQARNEQFGKERRPLELVYTSGPLLTFGKYLPTYVPYVGRYGISDNHLGSIIIPRRIYLVGNPYILTYLLRLQEGLIIFKISTACLRPNMYLDREAAATYFIPVPKYLRNGRVLKPSTPGR